MGPKKLKVEQWLLGLGDTANIFRLSFILAESWEVSFVRATSSFKVLYFHTEMIQTELFVEASRETDRIVRSP